jgi:hypothetical protein
MGMRAGGGVEFLTAPTNAKFDLPNGNPGELFAPPFFDDERTGYNYHIGWFAEMRFIEYIGLELGLGLTRHFLIEDVDWRYELTVNGSTSVYNATSRQEISWAGLTIPVMVKGIFPLGGARIWVGIGPEWFLGQWSRATYEVKSKAANTPSQAPIERFQNIAAKTVHDTYITWAIGFDVQAGEVVIPIALKFGWNLTQPDKYLDRIDFDRMPLSGDDYPGFARIRAADSMYGQLLVGIAYDVL